jgi:hypothetical protein
MSEKPPTQIDLNHIMPLWLEAIGMPMRRLAADRAEVKCPFHEGRGMKLGIRFRDRWFGNCMNCGAKGTVWDFARMFYDFPEDTRASVVRERIYQEVSEYQTSGPEAQNRASEARELGGKVQDANSHKFSLTPQNRLLYSEQREAKESGETRGEAECAELEKASGAANVSPVQKWQPSQNFSPVQPKAGSNSRGLKDSFALEALEMFGEEPEANLNSWEASNRASMWHRERTREMLENPGGSWKTPERNWRFKEQADLHSSPEKGCRNLAANRGITYEGVRLAHDWGHVKFAMWRNRPCWLLVADGGWTVEARRLDGKMFEGDVKARAFEGSTKARCLVGAEQIPLHRGPLRLVEGGPDFLAACSLFWMEGSLGRKEHLPIAVLSPFWAPRMLHILQLKGRHIQIVSHNDESGRKQATARAELLRKAGATVEIVHLTEFWVDAPEKADLNDLMKNEPQLLEELMR